MLTHRFDDALGFAVGLHRGQTRKVSGIPYIAHLLAVTALVLEQGGDEDMAIAALLHDAVEDQGGPPTARAIHTRFGPRVHDLVMACSDSDGAHKPDWDTRKQTYIASLAHKPREALTITACDKLHNAGSILDDLRRFGPSVFDRFTAGRAGTLWYYRALADALERHLPGHLSTRLSGTVTQIEIESGTDAA